jgi:hypothetical protein
MAPGEKISRQRREIRGFRELREPAESKHPTEALNRPGSPAARPGPWKVGPRQDVRPETQRVALKPASPPGDSFRQVKPSVVSTTTTANGIELKSSVGRLGTVKEKDGELTLVDPLEGLSHPFVLPKGVKATHFDVSDDGLTTAVLGSDRKLHLFRTLSQQPARKEIPLPKKLNAQSLSPLPGTSLFVAPSGTSLWVIDPGNGRVSQLETGRDVRWAAADATGTHVMVGAMGESAQVFKVGLRLEPGAKRLEQAEGSGMHAMAHRFDIQVDLTAQVEADYRSRFSATPGDAAKQPTRAEERSLGELQTILESTAEAVQVTGGSKLERQLTAVASFEALAAREKSPEELKRLLSAFPQRLRPALAALEAEVNQGAPSTKGKAPLSFDPELRRLGQDALSSNAFRVEHEESKTLLRDGATGKIAFSLSVPGTALTIANVSGEVIRKFDPVSFFALAPDGRTLGTVGHGRLSMWDLREPKPLLQSRPQEDESLWHGARKNDGWFTSVHAVPGQIVGNTSSSVVAIRRRPDGQIQRADLKSEPPPGLNIHNSESTPDGSLVRYAWTSHVYKSPEDSFWEPWKQSLNPPLVVPKLFKALLSSPPTLPAGVTLADHYRFSYSFPTAELLATEMAGLYKRDQPTPQVEQKVRDAIDQVLRAVREAEPPLSRRQAADLLEEKLGQLDSNYFQTLRAHPELLARLKEIRTDLKVD